MKLASAGSRAALPQEEGAAGPCGQSQHADGQPVRSANSSIRPCMLACMPSCSARFLPITCRRQCCRRCCCSAPVSPCHGTVLRSVLQGGRQREQRQKKNQLLGHASEVVASLDLLPAGRASLDTHQKTSELVRMEYHCNAQISGVYHVFGHQPGIGCPWLLVSKPTGLSIPGDIFPASGASRTRRN